MKIMKRIQFFLIMIFSAMIIGSCSDDTDDVEINLGNGALYELTLINGTDADVEVFFLGSGRDAEFERKGLLEAGQELVISNLVVRENYIVAAADPGSSLQNYFYEQTLNRTSPTDVTLTITR